MFFTDTLLKEKGATVRLTISGPTGTCKTRILDIAQKTLERHGYECFNTTSRDHEIALIPRKFYETFSLNKLLTFADYQAWQLANNPGLYPLKGHNIVFPAMKMAGEAGELADKIGKHWRNTYVPASACGALESRNATYEACCESMSAASLSIEQRQAIIEEMGDVLWYIYAMCNELDIALGEVAIVNIEKLKGRLSRGTIIGEGDNR